MSQIESTLNNTFAQVASRLKLPAEEQCRMKELADVALKRMEGNQPTPLHLAGAVISIRLRLNHTPLSFGQISMLVAGSPARKRIMEVADQLEPLLENALPPLKTSELIEPTLTLIKGMSFSAEAARGLKMLAGEFVAVWESCTDSPRRINIELAAAAILLAAQARGVKISSGSVADAAAIPPSILAQNVQYLKEAVVRLSKATSFDRFVNMDNVTLHAPAILRAYQKRKREAQENEEQTTEGNTTRRTDLESLNKRMRVQHGLLNDKQVKESTGDTTDEEEDEAEEADL